MSNVTKGGYDKRLCDYHFYNRDKCSKVEQYEWNMNECPYYSANPSFYVRDYSNYGKSLSR